MFTYYSSNGFFVCVRVERKGEFNSVCFDSFDDVNHVRVEKPLHRAGNLSSGCHCRKTAMFIRVNHSEKIVKFLKNNLSEQIICYSRNEKIKSSRSLQVLANLGPNAFGVVADVVEIC